MSKKQKILFFSILIFFLGQVFSTILFAKAAEPGVKEVEPVKVEGVDLEITYPEIFKKGPHPKAGLPQYIAYIYYFAVAIVGLLIFGILIYNGIKYLVSAGNVEVLISARRGILAGFLGAIILLSAVLIFNILSPHLDILPPPILGELIGPIPHGVYICNHNIPEIEGILNNYLSEDKELRKRAINDFVKTTYNRCWRASTGPTEIKKIQTIFTVPKREKDGWDYNEAIVIKDAPIGAGTKCEIFPPPQNNKIFYHKVSHGLFHVDEIWRIKKKVAAGTLVLYEGINYNEGEVKKPPAPEEKKEERKLAKGIYQLTEKDEVKIITKEDLKKAGLLEEGIKDKNLVKSIAGFRWNPPTFVVIMKGYTDILGMPICEIDEDGTDPNLENQKIGRCRPLTLDIYSCFHELIAIKGTSD